MAPKRGGPGEPLAPCAVQCGAVRCSAVQCGAMRCGAVVLKDGLGLGLPPVRCCCCCCCTLLIKPIYLFIYLFICSRAPPGFRQSKKYIY